MRNQLKILAILSLVVFGFQMNGQQTWVLRNNTNCSVGISYEYSDPTGCPQGGCTNCYTPCNSSSSIITIPAMGSYTLTACGNGIFGEVCVVINEIDLVPMTPVVHTRRLAWNCCGASASLSGNYPSGASCVGTFNINWNIIGRTWTIF